MAEADVPWFHHPAPCAAGDDVALDAGEAHHAQGSLRLKAGETVVLADGQGGIASAVVITVERRRVGLRVRSVERHPPPAPPALWLAPALIRGPRFDTLIEKSTELGVSGIAPIITRHTEIRTTPGGEKPERWRRLAVTALKQSRRAWLPEIAAPVAFDAFLEGVGTARLTVAHPTSGDCAMSQSLENMIVTGPPSSETPAREILFVGPEGGWHPAELDRLLAAGARTIHLGATRLRAETAALALLCCALVERGEFRVGPTPGGVRPASH